MNYKQKYMEINKYYGVFTLCFILIISVKSFAQMGVGTKNSNHPAEFKTEEHNVYVTEDGNLGLGVENPLLAIDLRSGDNGVLAIGMTNQTASEAGAGAVRYNPSPAIGVKGFIEFSDGEKWIPYHPYGRPRIVVMAEKTNDNVEVFEPGASPIGTYTDGIQNRSATYLTHWTEKLDSDSGTDVDNFDATKGEFIAPRDGVYIANFTFALEPRTVNNGDSNQAEAIWEVRNSNNDIIQRVKTNNGFPSDTPDNVSVGSTCYVSLYLNKGDKLRPFVWVSLDWGKANRKLLKEGGYNVLTIVEQ